MRAVRLGGRWAAAAPPAARFGAELPGRQPEALAGGEQDLPLVAAHVGFQQLARTEVGMDDNLRFQVIVGPLLLVRQ